jgi:hypothetical protein
MGRPQEWILRVVRGARSELVRGRHRRGRRIIEPGILLRLFMKGSAVHVRLIFQTSDMLDDPAKHVQDDPSIAPPKLWTLTRHATLKDTQDASTRRLHSRFRPIKTAQPASMCRKYIARVLHRRPMSPCA